jgi:outer membrane receptor protein involved in Fe transport
MNLGGLLSSGVDAELDWNWRLADLRMGARAGQLHLNSTVSWTKDYAVQQVPNSPWYNYAGTIPLPLSPTPPVPIWHALTTLSYQLQPVPLTVGLRWRYIAAMRDISTVLTPTSTIPGVPAYNYLDLVGNWKFSDRFELSGTVTNITSKVPPRVAATDGITQVGLYDITKLTYLLSLHAKF